MSERFYNMLLEAAGEGNVIEDEPMRAHTTFKIGGPADFFVTPASAGRLCETVGICRRYGVPYEILGNGSNVLVSDKGFNGAVIQIQKNICDIRLEGVNIYAEAGALLFRISCEAVKNSLGGFEFASGIPGTLGGAILMNAGAYGGEMKDVLLYADVFTPDEGIERVGAAALKLGYRTSAIKHSDKIILGAAIGLKKGDPEKIKAEIERLKAERMAKQPLDVPSAGSAFKRPEGNYAGRLIMEAGLRGYTIGGAAVSEKHCGFLVNKGGATASDMKKLFDKVIGAVKESSGVTLEPEVRFIGSFD